MKKSKKTAKLEIYGKHNFRNIINSMSANNRISHSIILTGEKGVGKKFCANYITQAIMCLEPEADGTPCGVCDFCGLVKDGNHSDVFFLETESGKVNYSVDSVREMILDTYIKSNDVRSVNKVYVITDCEKLNDTCQNALLKSIEEPLDSVYYIMTAEKKDSFLDTIISRSACIEISETTDDECLEALRELGGKKTDEDFKKAIGAWHGNIGRCLEYLKEREAFKQSEKVRAIVRAVIDRNEYQTLLGMGFKKGSGALVNNAEFLITVVQLQKFIRDVMVLKTTGEKRNMISCCVDLAEEYSRIITMKKAAKIHEGLMRVEASCSKDMNINTDAVRSYAASLFF